ncbi:MAG: 3-methyl-2-oxobutanoate hydroxymethyltransferase [Gemmatimonadetes bacterium]|nr:MAG: 3-methyl-2-oxobutanoate hydroxymethyltransferase [Gemmatimonadota bacterium]
MKRAGRRIVVLTAFDAPFARIAHAGGADMLLVGDSLAQVGLGYDTTLPVTLDEMVHHAAAVRRGAPEAFVVLDLPFMSYQASVEDALRAGGRALKEAGAQAVKLEGGSERRAADVRALVEAGIPVMGHVGLTPQSVHALGGYRVQGRGDADARRLRDEAERLQDAGCFSLVLELVPAPLAADISEALDIPTIGIGAGPGCDGQVLVTHDLLGLNPGFEPRFLKRYASLADEARAAVEAFAADVREGRYPDAEHSFDAE